MQDRQTLRNDSGLPSQINHSSLLDLSGELDKDYKQFSFFFTGIKKHLINAKQTLTDQKLSYEARVENTLRIIQNQLLGGSLFNQNADDNHQDQLAVVQNNLENDDSVLIHDTIQKIFSQNKQLVQQNKSLKVNLTALFDENKNCNAQILHIEELKAKLQQQLKNQQQKNLLQIKKYQTLQSQFSKYIQDTKLSMQKLSQQITQMQIKNSSLARQNSTFKLEINSLQDKNKRLSQQYQSMINNIGAQNINQDRPNELRNTMVNSLQQELLKLKDKKPSEDNEYFVNQIRGITEIQGSSNSQYISEESQKIIELEQKIQNLQKKEQIITEQNEWLKERLQALQMEVRQKEKIYIDQDQKQKLKIQSKDTMIDKMNTNLQQKQAQLQHKDIVAAQKDQIIQNLNNKYKKLKENNFQLSKQIQQLQLRLKETKVTQISSPPKANNQIAQITALNTANEQMINENIKFRDESKHLRKANEDIKQQLRKLEQKLEHLKRPTQENIYKLTQNLCNTLSANKRKEFKENFIRIISTM